MTPSDSAHPDWEARFEEGWLERYVLGDLNDAERQELEERLTEDADARARLKEIEPMDQFISQALSPFSISALEDRVIHNVRRRGRRSRPAVQKIAVAASTMLVFLGVGHALDPTTLSTNTVSGFVQTVPSQNLFAGLFDRAEQGLGLQADAAMLLSAPAERSLGGGGGWSGPEASLAGGEEYSGLSVDMIDGRMVDHNETADHEMFSESKEVAGNLNTFEGDPETVLPGRVTFSREKVSAGGSPATGRGDFFKPRGTHLGSRKQQPESPSLGNLEELEKKVFDFPASPKAELEVSVDEDFGEPKRGWMAPAEKPNLKSNAYRDEIDRLNSFGQHHNERVREQAEGASPLAPQADPKNAEPLNRNGYFYKGARPELGRETKQLEDRVLQKDKSADLNQAKESFRQDADKARRPAEPNQLDTGIKLIRSGEVTYEVDNYNATASRLVEIARENQGYQASESSERGANGRMRGTLVFRIKAEHFGRFMANIRAIGDLKHQDIRVQDVTKAYFDVESRIQSLEVRKTGLLKALEERKGDLEAYVQFEAKLAEVITQLERLKGELKFMSNQVSYSTLRVSLLETGVDSASAIIVNEKGQLDAAVPDVDRATDEAKRRALDLGAQMTANRINRGRGDNDASAHLVFEIAVGKYDELVKAIGELGEVTRLQRSSDDQVKDGKRRQSIKRQEGVGELIVTFYHLPAFIVADNHMSVQVASAPEAWDRVNALAGEGVRIIKKEIDSFTEKATRAGFELEIAADRYNEVAARLRSLGKVSLENGTPVPAVTPEGDPIPEFQATVVKLDVDFEKLGPITTETLSQQMHAENVQKAVNALKDEARKRGVRLQSQQGDERTRAVLVFDMPAGDYESFSTWIGSDKNAAKVGHVHLPDHWSLRESPEKMKEVPDFQEKRARITLTVRQLTPLVAEQQELGVKVEDVTARYQAIRGLVRDVAGHRILENHLDHEGNRAKLVCTVPVSAYADLVTAIRGLGEGKVVHKRSSSHIEDPDNPVPAWKTRVGRVEIQLAKMLPTEVRTNALTLFTENPEDLVNKVHSSLTSTATILDSKLITRQDGVREGMVVLQVPLEAYESTMTALRGWVDEDDVLANTGSSGNLADPTLKGEKLVAKITLKATNSREGAVAPGGAGAFIGHTLDKMVALFLTALNKVLVGLAFLAPFLVIFWLGFRMLRRRRES